MTDHAEALRHMRTLINVASQSDDIDTVHKLLREMRGVVNNALPPVRKTRTEASRDRAAHARAVRDEVVIQFRDLR
jgi:hypothetical protein